MKGGEKERKIKKDERGYDSEKRKESEKGLYEEEGSREIKKKNKSKRW